MSGSSFLETVQKIADVYGKYDAHMQIKSYLDIAKPTEIHPIVVISGDLINYKHMPSIKKAMLDLFAAYYISAAEALLSVDKIQARRTLDQLNPDAKNLADLMNVAVPRIQDNAIRLKSHLDNKWSEESFSVVAAESYQYSLPRLAKEDINNIFRTEQQRNKDISDRSNGVDKNKGIEATGKAKDQVFGVKVTVTVSPYDSKATITDVNNKDGKEDKNKGGYQLTTMIKLFTSVLPNSTIAKIISLGTDEYSLTERWHKWRSGQISFIKDFILCADILKEQKKALMTDKDGVYSDIFKRAYSNKAKAIITGKISFAEATSMFIISDSLAEELEAKLGGKLTKRTIRDKMFESTYAMMIAVVDQEWERVTIYYRDMDEYSSYSIKEIDPKVSRQDISLADFVKQLRTGNTPTF